MKTTIPKEEEIQRDWYLVDAAGKTAGRLAAEIAKILRGKNKAIFTPHVDTGDFVIVINAEKVVLTGSKEEQKLYNHHTGYPGGMRSFTATVVRERNPTRIIKAAVKGMVPKNRLGRKIFKRLKVYTGSEHPHGAQQPALIEL
jgi:large subunit ribosomal protein L13